MRIFCANLLRFLEFYLVLLQIFSLLASTNFAISFLVANFTTCLQLLIKVLSLSFTLFCYLAKNPSFRLFFYLTDPLKHFIPFWLFRSESVLFRYNLLVAASFSFHFYYYYVIYYYYVPLCLPFSDFSFGAINIVHATITRKTKIFELIVILFWLLLQETIFSLNLLHSSFLSVIYIHPIYVYIQFTSRGREGGWRFLLTWLFPNFLVLYLSLFFFNLSSLIIPISILYIICIRLLSSSSRFLFSSVVIAFLYLSYLARFLITILWLSLRTYDDRSASLILPLFKNLSFTSAVCLSFTFSLLLLH